MAVHRINKATNKPLCQKGFIKLNAQNFEVMEDTMFFSVLITQPKYCCKKCANKPK